MDDVKIINKEKDDKMTALLKDELHKDRMDPFKITTLIEMGADGFAKLRNNMSMLHIAVEHRFYAVISSVLLMANESNSTDIWDAFEL